MGSDCNNEDSPMYAESRARSDIERLQLERDTWRAFAIARGELLACYRINRKPSGKLLDTLADLADQTAGFR